MVFCVSLPLAYLVIKIRPHPVRLFNGPPPVVRGLSPFTSHLSLLYARDGYLGLAQIARRSGSQFSAFDALVTF
jgi:hypothetical protein